MINNHVSEPVTNPSKLFTTAMEDSICKLIKELNQPRIISTEQKKGRKRDTHQRSRVAGRRSVHVHAVAAVIAHRQVIRLTG